MAEEFMNDAMEEEEMGRLVYDDDDEDLLEFDDRWCLVGRFLTKQGVDFQAMQHKMATLWQPGRGMYVKELGPNHFFFQFYHEVDIERVIDGSPWTFDRAPLIFERVTPGANPRSIPLNQLDFGIQLHDMTSGFKSERVVRDVGNYIGKFVKSDPNNFAGVWRDYLRVRVTIRVDKPLEQKMKLEKKSGVSCKILFKYEDLPTFCFICGVLGHSERFCDRLFETPLHLIDKPYGLELKAAPRRRHYTMGAQWLRSAVVAKAGASSSHGGERGQHNNDTEKNPGMGNSPANNPNMNIDYGKNPTNQAAESNGDIYGKSKAIELITGSKDNDAVPSIQVVDLKIRKTIMDSDYNGEEVDELVGPYDKMVNDVSGVEYEDVNMGFNDGVNQKNFFGAGSGSQARRAL
ncbi:uncharacterized protein LOC115704420 [Cannabis sativa]|uniref:uncharacterized protein LOC115704420 n=1 Tax=Cannabis sativa TaxID=3483 RepID=UPI0029CA18EA|nr:uncharacterized protein LOC115704420 [Cannabis sativa]